MWRSTASFLDWREPESQQHFRRNSQNAPPSFEVVILMNLPTDLPERRRLLRRGHEPDLLALAPCAVSLLQRRACFADVLVTSGTCNAESSMRLEVGCRVCSTRYAGKTRKLWLFDCWVRAHDAFHARAKNFSFREVEVCKGNSLLVRTVTCNTGKLLGMQTLRSSKRRQPFPHQHTVHGFLVGRRE